MLYTFTTTIIRFFSVTHVVVSTYVIAYYIFRDGTYCSHIINVKLERAQVMKRGFWARHINLPTPKK